MKFSRVSLQAEQAKDVDKAKDGGGEDELERDKEVDGCDGEKRANLDNNVSVHVSEGSDPSTQEGIDLSENGEVEDANEGDRGEQFDDDVNADGDEDINISIDEDVNGEALKEGGGGDEDVRENSDIGGNSNVSLDIRHNFGENGNDGGIDALDVIDNIRGVRASDELVGRDGCREREGQEAEDGDDGEDELREEHG